ncbi:MULTISPECIES: sigma-70 family RNA polymerase sigma factor [Niallia]|uniref:sigma-70 family RNA polymerase sigma factor n=1 Tax=Niallia TaxID=2837506 RepID=UPI000F45CC8E|nr:sigma-70 family RNA polymerase sigma factor [Niallia circulans]AYV68969.1 RNA polymerase subunit sigma [Niallia circulans]AYV72639.1 RNA polymerase subunit sigma [Niallia circulans]NRG27092.1 sigma-70 family RNA polymerase sigma factor [Niallia circulans]QJX60456.1 sigma-70 family RNA polymerase sigma factor [Niallia circulans]
MEKQERDKLLTNAMDTYGHYLSRLAYALVKDREKAEDIVQDVFIRYYLQLDQFEGRSSVKTYLYRITVNECRNYFKSWAFRKVEVSKIKNTFLIHKETPEEAYLKQESKNYLADLLNKLPIKYKEVLWLYYYGELSTQEISEILNCSSNTVKTRLARGRKKAQLTMSEEEINRAKEH